jgi:hypothetical protein
MDIIKPVAKEIGRMPQRLEAGKVSIIEPMQNTFGHAAKMSDPFHAEHQHHADHHVGDTHNLHNGGQGQRSGQDPPQSL